MNVKDVLVEIRTARESFPAFDARLFEEENFLAIRGEFEITECRLNIVSSLQRVFRARLA